MRLTERRAEWIAALQQPGRYLLTRNGAALAPSLRDCLTGCHVIELVDDQEVSVLQLHRNSAAELVDGGYLVQRGIRPLSGQLYQLSEAGMAINPHVQVTRRAEGAKARVMLADIDAKAAVHGYRLKRVKARAWYELVRTNGAPLRYPTLTNENGVPVARLSDMSADEWAAAIERCIEKNKA